MLIHNLSCWTTHMLLLIAGAVAFSTFAPVHQIPSRSEWNNVRRPMFGSRCRVSFGGSRMSSTNQDECFHVIHDLKKDTSSSTGGGIPWLDDDDDLLFGIDDDDDGSSSIGKSIGMGQSILCLPEIASQDECRHLFMAAFQAAQSQSTPATRGRSRFSVSDPNIFDGSIVFTGEEILLRVLDYLDDHVPSIYQWLFDPVEESWAERQPLNAALEQPNTPPEIHLGETCTGLRDLYMQGALEWSEGEPAINIYQGGGYFGAHKDHLALTVLIPLTSADEFEGGGTGFWAGNRAIDEKPNGEPDLVLKPPPGSALIFGGDVTHCGMPVSEGVRSVLVCSFSTVTPASNPDRLHGLQAPPKVSADFKGA